jgi:hypothetical protein
MSYGITVKSNHGQLEVSGYGDIPDGEHDLTGHDHTSTVSGGFQARSLSLAVTRRGADGRYVTSAQHTETREG